MKVNGIAETFTAAQEQELAEIEDKLIFDNTLDKSLHDGVKYIDPDLAKSDPDFYVIKSRVGRGLLVRNIKSTFKLEWFRVTNDYDVTIAFDRFKAYIDSNNLLSSTLALANETYQTKDRHIVLPTGVALLGSKSTVIEATVKEYGAVYIPDNCIVRDITFTYSGEAIRTTHPRGHRIVFVDATHSSVVSCSVEGGSSAGVFVRRSSYILIRDIKVKHTLADGVHVTESSSNVTIQNIITNNTGDDGVAVVSYVTQNGVTQLPCKQIVMDNINVSDINHGRGITVVGGEHITINNFKAFNVTSAGLLIASEEGFGTYGNNYVTATNGHIASCGNESSGAITVTGRSAVYKTDNIWLGGITVENSTQVGVAVGDATLTPVNVGKIGKVTLSDLNILTSGSSGLKVGDTDIITVKNTSIRNSQRYGTYLINIYSKASLLDVIIDGFNLSLSTFRDALIADEGTVQYLALDNLKVINAPAVYGKFIESVNKGEFRNMREMPATEVHLGAREGDVIWLHSKITSASGLPITGTWQVGDVSYELDGTALCHRCIVSGEFGTATLPVFVTV